MSRTSGRSQRVAELERALANGFPSESTVVAHADDASGRLTIQVAWVREPTEEHARAWRCAIALRFDADAIGCYASLDAADRLRVRTHLCDLARRAVDERKPHVEDAAIECNAALDVTRAGLDAALRAP